MNWLLLLFAFAAVFSIMLIGVFIAEKALQALSPALYLFALSWAADLH